MPLVWILGGISLGAMFNKVAPNIVERYGNESGTLFLGGIGASLVIALLGFVWFLFPRKAVQFHLDLGDGVDRYWEAWSTKELTRFVEAMPATVPDTTISSGGGNATLLFRWSRLSSLNLFLAAVIFPPFTMILGAPALPMFRFLMERLRRLGWTSCVTSRHLKALSCYFEGNIGRARTILEDEPRDVEALRLLILMCLRNRDLRACDRWLSELRGLSFQEAGKMQEFLDVLGGWAVLPIKKTSL